VPHTNLFSYTSVGFDTLCSAHEQLWCEEQYGDSALDYSIGWATAVVVSSVGAQCKYLEYLHHSNYYAGLGATMDMGIATAVPVVWCWSAGLLCTQLSPGYNQALLRLNQSLDGLA